MMKPLLICVPAIEKDGKVHLTIDDLERLINKAYNAGYSDGMNHGPCYPSYPATATWDSSTSTKSEDKNTKLTQ